jgi:hypothetical protein
MIIKSESDNENAIQGGYNNEILLNYIIGINKMSENRR